MTASRFTVIADSADATLARALLAAATERDTFPGLPRPKQRVTIAIARDAQSFRRLAGGGAPEWGAAVAIPGESRIVMHGRAANSRVGDPCVVLRHELAHLALHEALGDRPPRWFDEGYASFSANEWGRDEMLAANLALAMRRGRTLAGVDSGFDGGQMSAEASYALAHRAVAELAALDRERGLSLLFRYWRDSPRLDPAMRRAYGITLDGFERRWQERTRLRYGALAVFADLTVASLVLLAVVVPLYVMRLRRDRRRLEAMRAADAFADQRATASVIDDLLRTIPPATGPDQMIATRRKLDTSSGPVYTSPSMADLETTARARPALWWGLAAGALILGYADLARGGETIAPILLVIGYCILVPVAILK